jgi:hypothetical protein
MKILPGSSTTEFILHFENTGEFEQFFEQAETRGYFELRTQSTFPADCTFIARTEGSPRTRRIKPLRIRLGLAGIQRIIFPEQAKRKPEPLPKPRPPAPAPAAAQAEEQATDEERSTNRNERIHGMSVTEKTHLALKADFLERRALMQENNPKIQEFLLRNPRITEPEIAWLAKNPLSPVHTVLTILQNKAWMSVDSIRAGILTNPKTPPANVFDMIPRVSSADLMRMSQSRVLREDIRAAVLREAKKRGLRIKAAE